eukprot:8496019-Pyramimonas_sp.AAC.1
MLKKLREIVEGEKVQIDVWRNALRLVHSLKKTGGLGKLSSTVGQGSCMRTCLVVLQVVPPVCIPLFIHPSSSIPLALLNLPPAPS